MTPKSTSFRLPEITTAQLEGLCRTLGTTQTQIIIMAVDRMAREELDKEKQKK